MPFFTKYPPQGQGSTVAQIATVADLASYGPANGAQPGDVAVTFDDFSLHVMDNSAVWHQIGGLPVSPTFTNVTVNNQLLPAEIVMQGPFPRNISNVSSITSDTATVGGFVIRGATESPFIGGGNTSASGSRNSGLGVGSLAGLTSGSYNTMVGYNSGILASSSNYNSALGHLALQSLTTGAQNVGIGASAGFGISTQNQNTCVGTSSNISGNFSNATALGFGATATASNSMELGNGSLAFIHTAAQMRAASLGVGNSAAASTPGSVVKKMQVFDASGASLGYVAIYDAIT